MWRWFLTALLFSVPGIAHAQATVPGAGSARGAEQHGAPNGQRPQHPAPGHDPHSNDGTQHGKDDAGGRDPGGDRAR